ncbi:hypothetical protein [Aneurinibacillus migulanus]|uniref:Uncharacterized protein n=1 Tax=Aneurinibacillus migulanus TaxID=47500 RepID=A0A0D1XRK2_ANEMI|nr:hypothetical protein [Aneurinibacillus migulanus]KIV54783.1 hypothetical protein TS65_18125 [Aneurinibacillus migulanus]KON96630.1 hypothetical protein AF333_15260 [Aneurinibacillus migulanus]MED0896784.1 hypothetical protein [Aneurinibacillus migulanus]MED1617918.1 hypothetical protein [Aneurinibacillus migulanus]SDJ51222.1 hypothetical protein SAMN04487909_11982 [Aneurinibacillus migulanus]
MKKVVTTFLAISLLATTPAFAAEQENDPIQQEEGMIQQGKDFWWRELTVDEIMAQKGMKSALESFYDKFPRTKAYKISGYKVKKIENDEEKNEILLSLVSDKKESFSLTFDIKTEKIIDYTQIVDDIPESELPGTVQASLNKVYSRLPEAKNLKLYHSQSIKGEEQPNLYYTLSFNESGKRGEGKTNDKEFGITFDETGKVLGFTFERPPLSNLKGNTKEEKAQDMLKRLYGEEANEYKIKKVSNDSTKNHFQGSIVFMPISSEKEPILVEFNSKDEIIRWVITSRDFLEGVGLLQ